MAKTIVGVDIGSETIRAVELGDPGKPRPTLLRYAEVPLTEGAVSRGEVLEPNTVGMLLKELWNVGGFKTKKVVLGMGNQRVLARDLSVPTATRQRIRESLPFVAQEMLPVPVQDALLDFYPVSESMTETGPMTHGLLIAAVKEAVVGNVKAVQAAGLTPVEVDLIPFALGRLLVSRPRLQGTIALVDVGANTTSVVVSADGVPQFVRIIAAGGADVTAGLASRLGIPPEEAERQKRLHGIAPVEDSPASRAVAPAAMEVISDLLVSLRNTISYYSNTRPSHPVGGILLTGGGSLMPGFADALADFTRVPARIADPIPSVAISRHVDAQKLRFDQAGITVALGLAMGSEAA
ncbi:type IV pilus assembly protein PilM [Leifsonia sp. AG29]|uniref:type IV pilus assembly protein PilM n=1 Tax=Leifsonia sp. AG29 TaxID=2598860 RepID=UPI00131DAD29|nr:type IV pilus assembly protein PilM [Leifsonia sp. AG29]